MKTIFHGTKDLFETMEKHREWYENEKNNFSFDKKLKIMVLLQKKLYAMGQMKMNPWPIDTGGIYE